MDRWEHRGRGAYKGVCVCCDRWPWQWEAGREDGSNSAPAQARPTCGCTRRVSAPWPAFIFRAQSYIGMIANVQLISLSSAAGPIWISVRWNAGSMKTQVKKKTQKKQQPWNKYPLCYSFRLHMNDGQDKNIFKKQHTHAHTLPLQVLVAPSHPCCISLPLHHRTWLPISAL